MNYFGDSLQAQLVETRARIEIDIRMDEAEIEQLTAEEKRVSAKLYANRCRLEHLNALMGPAQEEPPL